MRFNQDYKSAFRILKKGRIALCISVATANILVASPMSNALPTNPNIVSGNVSINTNSSNMTINQTTNKGIINWSAFDIGANASVRFNQPNASATTLNRVVGDNASQIAGQMSANGKVILINPNGVIFDKGARVDVGGIVATTMNMSDSDFLNSTYKFTRDNSTGKITNSGTITTADEGYVALLAPEVINDGVITAQKGSIAFASGDSITLNFGSGLLGVEVTSSTVSTLIENRALVEADGGSVYMSAKSASEALSATINNTGTIQANSVEEKDGKIILTTNKNMSDTGKTSATNINLSAEGLYTSGTMSAKDIKISTTDYIEQVKAGKITTNGGSIAIDGGTSTYMSGTVSADNTNGKGGDISITANSTILAGADVSADGTSGGGLIRVGGGWQGKDSDIVNADTTLVSKETKLTANALQDGNGGTIVVWSEKQTSMAGTIEVRGGANSGDGGKIEVSSHNDLAFVGTVDTKAPYGKNGSLLLDPKNINIETDVMMEYTKSTFTITGTNLSSSTANVFFGNGGVKELPNGNYVVITNAGYVGGSDGRPADTSNGGIRLYSPTGVLLSRYYATATNWSDDYRVTVLPNNNLIIINSNWNGPEKYRSSTGAGLITWMNGTTGALNDTSIGGSMNGANTLYGNVGWTDNPYQDNSWDYSYSAATRAGAGGVHIINGSNFVNALISTPSYGSTGSGGGGYGGDATSLGAVTWIDGATGKFADGTGGGYISSSNSMIGQSVGDSLGWGHASGTRGTVYNVGNGNVVLWSKSVATNTPARVVWINGATGKSAGDTLGGINSYSILTTNGGSRVIELSDGNYVIGDGAWSSNKGYALWMDGTTGKSAGGAISPTIDATTALIGGGTEFYTGDVLYALSGGKYAVRSSGGVGYFTHIDGSKVGTVSTSNSLYGSTLYDLNYFFVKELTNGNIVVSIPYWDNAGVVDAGAVVWVDGTTGYAYGQSSKGAAVSTANSLYGTATNDRVGNNPTVLSNGNYVIGSSSWNSDKGAVTWANGTTGMIGAVSSSNSLVGSNQYDAVGNNISALSNGNYVVRANGWKNSTATSAGAVVWQDGSTSGTRITGPITTANALVGSTANDWVGYGFKELGNGNFVIISSYWDNGANADTGAITWFDSTGKMANGSSAGVVSATNSMIGPGASRFGESESDIYISSTNNFVVKYRDSNSDGFVRFVNGETGAVGVSNTTNSFSNLGQSWNTSVNVLADGNFLIGNYSSTSYNGYVSNSTGKGYVSYMSGLSGVVGTTGIINPTQYTAGAILAYGYVGGDEFGKNIALLSVGDNRGGFIITDPNVSFSHLDAYRIGMGTFFKPIPPTTLSGDLIYSTTPTELSKIPKVQLTNILNAGTDLTLQASNDIIVNGAFTVNNPSGNGGTLKLQAGRNITFNANVTTDNGNLIAIAGDSGAITANTDTGAPTITIASGVVLNVGTGTATLVANKGLLDNTLDGKFVNSAGNTAINGRYLIYASDPTTTTEGFTTYNKHYNQTYTAGQVPTYASSGNWIMYSLAPEIKVKPSKDHTMTYGDTAPTISVLEYIAVYADGDTETSAGISGTATFSIGGATSTGGRLAYGGHNVSYTGGLTSALGYVFVDASDYTSEVYVNKKDISLSGLTAQSKVYNNSTSATITGTATVTPLSGDIVSLNGTVSGGSFASANAGLQTVTVNGISGLGGADASNYNLLSSFSATISKAPLTVTADDKTKVYDKQVYSGSYGITYDGFVAGETSTVLNLTNLSYGGTSSSGVNAGSYTIVPSGITATNYDITYVNGALTITKAPLTITARDKNKTYNGAVYGNANFDVSYGGFVPGDNDANAVSGTISYSGSATTAIDVGNTYTITPSGQTSSNYDITYANGTLTINTKTLGVTGAILANKTYDGRDTADMQDFGTLSGVVSGDDVSIDTSNIVAWYDTVASGSNKTGGVQGYGLSGAKASNYTVVDPTGLTGDIAKATLRVVANDDAKFVTQNDANGYNGVSYSGFVNGETVSAITINGLSIARNNSSVNSAGTYDGVLVASGLSATNYDFDYVAGSYTVVPADTLLVRVQNASTTYGTGATFTITSAQYLNNSNQIAQLNLNGVSAGTNFSLSDGVGGTATFDLGASDPQNSTAGKLKAGSYQLDATNVTESSNNFSNNIVVIGGLTVNTKAVTASANNVSKVYDSTTGMNNVSLDLNGVESGDIVLVSGVGSFSQKNVGTNLSYTISNVALDSTDADNYYLSGGNSFNGNNGSITAKSITITADSANKVYDGNTNATSNLSSSGIYNGDTVNITGTSVFDNKNAGTNKTVTTTGLAISGSDASNYTLSSTTTTSSANITKLSSVTWVGGTSGDWSNANNWAGGAIPDLENVENVIIPTSINVTFDTNVAGPVSINNLYGTSSGVGGGVSITGGTLNILNNINLGTYTQSGGTVDVSGDLRATTLTYSGQNLNVDGDIITTTYTQSGGTSTVGGDVSTGTYTQTGGTSTITGGLTASTGVSFDGDELSVGGDVSTGTYTQTSGTSTITGGLTASTGVSFGGDELSVGGDVSTGTYTQTGGTSTLGGDLETTTFTYAGQVLSVAGNLTSTTHTQSGGSLDVGEDTTTGTYTQTGGTITGKNLTATTGFDQNGGTITMSDDVNINQNSGGVSLGEISTKNITVTSPNGGITQDSGTKVVSTGKATFDAGDDHDVTIENEGNNFNEVGLKGKNVGLRDDDGGVKLDDTSAKDKLTVTSKGGDIEQTSGSKINNGGGTATFTATNGNDPANVKLDNDGNDFGTVGGNGKDITIKDDKGGVTLDNITAKDKLQVTSTDGEINQKGGSKINNGDGEATFIAKKGGEASDITLDNDGNDFGIINADGKNVSIKDDKGGITLGDVTAKEKLQVTSNDGDITQKVGTKIDNGAGEATFKARKDGKPSDIILDNEGNDFGIVSADGKNISLRDDKDGLTLDKIIASQNLKVQTTKGDIKQTSTGSLDVGGESTFDADGNIDLPNLSNKFGGKVNVKANKAKIATSGALLRGNVSTIGAFEKLPKDEVIVKVPQELVKDIPNNNVVVVAQNTDTVKPSMIKSENGDSMVVRDRVSVQNAQTQQQTTTQQTSTNQEQVNTNAQAGDVQNNTNQTQNVAPTAVVVENTPVENATFDGLKIGATATGNDVKAIIVQSAPTSKVALTMIVAVKPNEGFSFSLPTTVVSSAVGAETTANVKPQVNAQMSDGKPLPNWVSFDGNNMSFNSNNVPEGGLPLTVQVNVTTNGVTKSIEVVLK